VLAFAGGLIAAATIALLTIKHPAAEKATVHLSPLQQKLENLKTEAHHYFDPGIMPQWIRKEAERAVLLQSEDAKDLHREQREFTMDDMLFSTWLAQHPRWSEPNLRPLLAGYSLSIELNDPVRAFHWSSMAEEYAKESQEDYRFLLASTDSIHALQLWAVALEHKDPSAARDKYHESLRMIEADLLQYQHAGSDQIDQLLEYKVVGYQNLSRTDQPKELKDHLTAAAQACELILQSQINESAPSDAQRTVKDTKAAAKTWLPDIQKQLTNLPASY
jgi:hypothetical protein